MKRSRVMKLGLTILILSFSFLSPMLTSAQTDIQITEYAVDIHYPERLDFFINLNENLEINSASLFLQPRDAETNIQIEDVLIDGKQLSWVYPLSDESTLPLFEVINFRVELELADGALYKSPTFAFFFTDNRFEWIQLKKENTTIVFHQGSEEFSAQIFNIVEVAKSRIQNSLNLSTPEIFQIVIYEQFVDMHSSNNFSAGKIFFEIAPGDEYLITTQRTITKDILWLVLENQYPLTYQNIPQWIIDGINLQILPDKKEDIQTILTEANAEHTFLSYQTLCDAYPQIGKESMIASAQSFSLIDYIFHQSGSGGIKVMLDLSAEGVPCQEIFEPVFGKPSEQMMQEWKFMTFTGAFHIDSILPWLILLLGICIPLFTPLILKPKKKILADG